MLEKKLNYSHDTHMCVCAKEIRIKMYVYIYLKSLEANITSFQCSILNWFMFSYWKWLKLNVCNRRQCTKNKITRILGGGARCIRQINSMIFKHFCHVLHLCVCVHVMREFMSIVDADCWRCEIPPYTYFVTHKNKLDDDDYCCVKWQSQTQAYTCMSQHKYIKWESEGNSHEI